MIDLRTAAQQALEALEFSTLDAFMLAPISPGRESTIKAITALKAALAEPEGGGNLPPPLPGDFDHAIGADRFKVVRGAFWWHVLIGDSPTEHGKFRSRASAEKMAADLLREFRNGAFVQHEAALAEPVQEPRTAWDDPRVQKVYDLLCDDAMPPNKQEHWEGWVARRIVDALAELTGKKGLQVEPVAYWHKRGQEDEQFIHAEAVNGDCPDCEPLYLAPQEHALEIRACECSAAKNGRCVMGDYGSLPIGTKLYAAEPCQCGDRPAAQCPGEWEPGCDLGNNPEYAKRLEMTPKELAASIKRGEKWKVAEPVQDGKCKHCVDGCPACDARKLPVQEPVAWVLALPDGRLDRLSVVAYDDEANEMLQRSIAGCTLVPLYPAPPQRPAEPVREPVAKVELMTTGGNAGLATRIVEIDDHLRERLRPGQLLYTAPPQRKPEPNSDYERGFVDGMSEQARRSVDKAVNAMTKCKPLAEEEIARLVTNDMVKFARAIERAHGIT